MATATATAGPDVEVQDSEARGQIVLTASADFRAWLKDFARFLRVSGSAATDNALAHYAEAKGFRAPPPR